MINLPMGSYTDLELGINLNTKRETSKGYWCNARPEPFRSFFTRLKMAWDVLTYKADSIYWEDTLTPHHQELEDNK